ncbi:DUF5681 domain-containing protein [uncultured Enterovirga sp.]|uniref:DUF5681 domain-containing protein n=1 Tax=uncultured Enterovirga sp. TaxID=2026352 RepID=UPI0035C993EC
MKPHLISQSPKGSAEHPRPGGGAPDGQRVGHKSPPLHTRFTAGKSGNPSGRPKGSKNIAKQLEEELSELVRITTNGATRKIPKGRALVKALVTTGLQGDVRAILAVCNLMARMPEEGSTEQKRLSPNDVNILKDFLKSHGVVDPKLGDE